MAHLWAWPDTPTTGSYMACATVGVSGHAHWGAGCHNMQNFMLYLFAFINFFPARPEHGLKWFRKLGGVATGGAVGVANLFLDESDPKKSLY